MAITNLNPDWSKSGSYWFELWDHAPRDQLAAALTRPAVGVELSDDAAMFLAAAAALQGAGNVSPNPMVGSVIVDKDNRFLACGAHLKVGLDHAEINALSSVKNDSSLQGATVFVTLEPCAHVGRTPSCAHALAQLPIRRVVYAVGDPNPLVNGKGHQILDSAGKEVEVSLTWRARVEWLTRVFLHNQRYGELFTALKVASSPDGFIAKLDSTRFWITGERARQLGHYLRLEYDAIVVGSRTLLLDDPLLTVRHPLLTGRTPLRLVLDPQNIVTRQTRAFKMIQLEPERTVIVSGGQEESLTRTTEGLTTLTLPLDQAGFFDFQRIKAHLWDFGLRSLLIEGGAGVYQSALSSQAVDAIHWFVGQTQISEGIHWSIPLELKNRYSKNEGLRLDGDRVIEFGINRG
jgi:diaminohydroxyphosphoribosylaminopyrimidine deaminase/5-amino-6-(5-phosphoribosylamino)uracil reductase